MLHGEANGVVPEMRSNREPPFIGPVEFRRIPLVGHNLPAEAPGEVARALLKLMGC